MKETSFLTTCLTYSGFFLLLAIGHINFLFFYPKYKFEKYRQRYGPPLFTSLEKVFQHYYLRRSKDVCNRVITGVPGAVTTFINRVSTDNGWSYKSTEELKRCINLGSYNYLGFGQEKSPCTDDVVNSIESLGIATCSPRTDLGK